MCFYIPNIKALCCVVLDKKNNSVTFHLGLHYLQKYPFLRFQSVMRIHCPAYEILVLIAYAKRPP